MYQLLKYIKVQNPNTTELVKRTWLERESDKYVSIIIVAIYCDGVNINIHFFTEWLLSLYLWAYV